MSEPKYEEVKVTLRKQLRDNEEICHTCGGLGVIMLNNGSFEKNCLRKPSKLEGENVNKTSILFPLNESLCFCPDCYNGVVRRCKYCGKILPKNRLRCDCEEQQKQDQIEVEKTEQRIMDRAEEKPASDFGMFYSPFFSYNNGYFEDFEEFFDSWSEQVYDEEQDDNDRPEYVYGTVADKMKIDATDIVENALECFYEDAIMQIDDEDFRKLQDYLDNWCKNCGVGESYYVDKNVKVKIPWEEYEYD